MYKKKPFLITFEGIEGSGKSYHSKKLYNKIKNEKNISAVYTREPGGTPLSEKIRRLILFNKKDKFDKFTDLLLYIAARNENYKKKIAPDLLKKKVIICDRFIDSTLAYQSYGFGLNKNIIHNLHKEIMGNFKPHYTFLLISNVNTAIKRTKKRKISNRYDKFSLNFYKKVQKGFIKIAKRNKKKYMIINTNQKINFVEDKIYNQCKKLLIK